MSPEGFKKYVYLDRIYVVGKGKPSIVLVNAVTKFFWVDLDSGGVWENHISKGWVKTVHLIYDPGEDQTATAGDVLWDGEKFFIRSGGQWSPAKHQSTIYPENVAAQQAKAGIELKIADADEETAKPAKLYEGFGRTYIVGEGTPSLIVKNTVDTKFWWLDTKGGKQYRNSLHGWVGSNAVVCVGVPEGNLLHTGALWIDKAGDIYLRLDSEWHPLAETGVIYTGGKPQTVKDDITVDTEKEAVVPEAKPVVELRKYDGGKTVPRIYYVGDNEPQTVPDEGEKKIYWVKTTDNTIHKWYDGEWTLAHYYTVRPDMDGEKEDGDVVLGNGEITVFKWGKWTKLDSVPMTGVTVKEPVASPVPGAKTTMFKSALDFGWKPTIVYVSTEAPDKSVTYTEGHFTFWANPATGDVYECPPTGWGKTGYKATYEDSTTGGDYWVNVSKDHQNAKQHCNGKWETLNLIGTAVPDAPAAEPADGVKMYKAEGEVIQYYVAPFGPEQYMGIGEDIQYFAQYWLSTKDWKLYYWAPKNNAWYHSQWKVFTLPVAAYADAAIGNVLYKDGELFVGTGSKYKGTTEYAVHPAHLSKALEAKPPVKTPKTLYVDKTLVQKFYHQPTKTLAYIAGFGPEHVQDNVYMTKVLLKKLSVYWIDKSTKQVWLRNEDGKWQKSERVFGFDQMVIPAVGDFLMYNHGLHVCAFKSGSYTDMNKETVGTDSLILTAESMLAEPVTVKPVKQEVKRYRRNNTVQEYWVGACVPLSAAQKAGNFWVNPEAGTILRWFASKKVWVKAETTKGAVVLTTSVFSQGKPGGVCISHGTVYSWEKTKWVPMILLDTPETPVEEPAVAAAELLAEHEVDLSCHDEGNVYTGQYGKLPGLTYYVKAGLPVAEAGGEGHVWVDTASMAVWHWGAALGEWVSTKHTAHAKGSGGGVPATGESGDGDVLVTNSENMIWVRDGGSWCGAVREDVPFPGVPVVPAEAGNMVICVHPAKHGWVYYIGASEPTPDQEHGGAFWVDVKGGKVRRWNGLTNWWVIVAGYYVGAEPPGDVSAGSVKWVSGGLEEKGFYVKVPEGDWKKLQVKPQDKTGGPVPGVLMYKHPTKNRTYHFALGKPQNKYSGHGAYWVDTDAKTIYAWDGYSQHWQMLKSACYTIEDGELPAKAVQGSVACLTSGSWPKMFVRIAGTGWAEMTALDGAEQPAETVPAIPVKKDEKDEKDEKKAAAGVQYFTPVGIDVLARVYIISHEKPEPLSLTEMHALEKSKQYWVNLTDGVIKMLDWNSSWVPVGKDTLYTGEAATMGARNLWVQSKDGAVTLAFIHHKSDWFAMTEVDPGTGKKLEGEGGGTLTIPAGAVAAAVKEKPVLTYEYMNERRFCVGTLKQRDEFEVPVGGSMQHYWIDRVGLCIYYWQGGKWKKLSGVKFFDSLDAAKTSTDWTFCLDEPTLHVYNTKAWFHLQPETDAAETVKTAVWPGGTKILTASVESGYTIKLYLSADEPENVPFESDVIQQWVNPVTGKKFQKTSVSGAVSWANIDGTGHAHIKLDAVADGEGVDYQYSTDEDYGLIYISHHGKWYKMEPVSGMTQAWVVWRYKGSGAGGLYILKSQDPPAEDVLPNEDCLKFWVNTDTEVVYRWSITGGKWSKTAMPYFPEGKGGITEKDWAVRWYEGNVWVVVPSGGWKKLKSDTAMGIAGGAPVVPEPTMEGQKKSYALDGWLPKMLPDKPVKVSATDLGLPPFTVKKGGIKYLSPATMAKLMGSVVVDKQHGALYLSGEVADVLTVNGTKYFKEGTGPLEGGGGGSAGLGGGAKPKGSVLDHEGASADAVAEGVTLEPGDMIMVGAGVHVGKIVSVGKVTYLNDGKYYVAFKVSGAWFSELPHKLVLLEKVKK